MSNGFGIELQGLQSIRAKLKSLRADAEDILSEEMEVAQDNIELAAKNNVPTDLGNLKNTIRPIDGGKLLKGVEVTAKYAPYVEFGTGIKVSVPEGLEAYAMTFFVNGKGRMPAKPYLFPALETERVKFIERLKKSLGAK